MNYLAHLLLASPDPELMAGSVAADFLKGFRRERLSAGVEEGVRLHHAIDRFTDEHPAAVRSRRRFPKPYRRYGGILVDLFYDHFLAFHWERHGNGAELAAFAASAYRVLEERESELPPGLRRTLPSMVRHDWLTGYRSVEGVRRALQGVSRRLRRENPLASAADQLEQHYEGLEADFAAFFPQVVSFAFSRPEKRGRLRPVREP